MLGRDLHLNFLILHTTHQEDLVALYPQFRSLQFYPLELQRGADHPWRRNAHIILSQESCGDVHITMQGVHVFVPELTSPFPRPSTADSRAAAHPLKLSLETVSEFPFPCLADSLSPNTAAPHWPPSWPPKELPKLPCRRGPRTTGGHTAQPMPPTQEGYKHRASAPPKSLPTPVRPASLDSPVGVVGIPVTYQPPARVLGKQKKSPWP